MFLYGLTLQRGGQITCCCHGQFSGTKQQVRNMLSINANTCDPIVTRRRFWDEPCYKFSPFGSHHLSRTNVYIRAAMRFLVSCASLHAVFHCQITLSAPRACVKLTCLKSMWWRDFSSSCLVVRLIYLLKYARLLPKRCSIILRTLVLLQHVTICISANRRLAEHFLDMVMS